MLSDPIIDELRRERKALEQETGQTVEGLFAFLKQWRSKHPEAIVTDAMINNILQEKQEASQAP